MALVYYTTSAYTKMSKNQTLMIKIFLGNINPFMMVSKALVYHGLSFGLRFSAISTG